ncbi:serine/threonine protein kinase [Pseudoalteromonas sp. A3]|uniref:serine/threonine-protein kinase n=1 Tax=unclassified Pseudoalteromonas TaxID=194690 RepID=UPI000ED95976|nr:MULTISPECIES: serine/threonine-protein kinase [unclassified Pseudoalteromonas]MCK8116784.1 serine/threonine protein kinase [Pseudoalteromonas sp. 2CM37A]MCW1720161.1 serine/threonine protein kinase [Pseudoalteromonas sp. A3]HAG41082.1 serine/threonine protein kinase [Pseudoalteromonas sp.]|tara:strand:+ start:21123 stop:23096 length:1974 start_codon:yes stop_codon:yes gene_type:complete
MSGINNSNDKTQIASLDSNLKKPQAKNKLNLIGKKISARYLVEELIGQGGMCYIYRARDLFLESPSRPEVFVAIKVLLEEFSHSEEAITLLKDETTKTQQLAHPNIVKVYSAGSDGDLHYVTMELVEGETLEQIIKRNKPTGMVFKKAKVILEQLADALIYAHARGVIHNDLKPSNIIFDSNGNLKVLDFGIAKHKTIEDAYAVQNQQNAAVVGGYTPTYASPEQLKGAEASVKDDVFSYACIALELLSSKHPFNRVAADKLAKETSAKRPSNCPLWLWGSLNKAIALNASDRLSSLDPITAKLNHNYKPAIALVASLVVATVLAGQYYLSNDNNVKQLEAKLDNAQAINQQVKTWMSWSGPSILDKLSEIPPQYEVLKQGLLRVNQESVLQSFDGMANQLNNSGDKFKNFDETIDVYTQALEYYPDSEKLSVQLESILRERQSIIFDITSRINLLLEQSRYNEVDNNSIPQLILDLHEVDKTYVYQVSPTHFENYKKALENAIAKDDVVTQSSLISVGKAILDKKQKSEVSFESLLQRESAIIALTDYQDKLNQGKEVVFPSNAALVFYEQRFERYSKQLTVIDKYKDLIALEELIDSESTILPNDFPLLVSIRQELSKRYITMANSLMKKRMYRTAETLVERSEAITKSLDSIML